jgi:DNA invertase Pin-like site-specific DNA recombinase
MEINDKGKKVSKKTRRETGRPSKRDALTKDQERHIDAWISKSIKLSDCIKLTGLSKATLYRIKSERV